MADTELVFPEKRVFIKPVTVIQLIFTIIGGFLAAGATLWNVRPVWRPVPVPGAATLQSLDRGTWYRV